MSKIIGVTVGTTLPKPNFKQTDPTKGDYIKNKPDFDGLKSKVEQIEVRVDTMQENAYDDTELRGVVSENVARIDTLNELVGNTKVETQIGDAVATLESEIDNKLNTMQSAIDSKVDAEDGKGLSTNDYTTAEKDKLATIEDNANFYEHPVHTSYDSGLYKVTVDGEGHVYSAAFVEKEDIVALGIPAQDTTYDKEISDLSDRIDYEAGLRENTNDGLLMVFEEFNKYKESNNKAVSANASGINVNQLAIAEIQEDYLKEADKIQLQDEIKKASDKATENTEAIKILNGEGVGSVKQSIDNAFNEFAANVTNDDVVNTYKELIDYAATHGSEFTELVGVVDKINNDVTGIETDISNYKIAVLDQLSEVNASINTIQGTLENKADSEHDHNDLYYTKDEILESITVDDIDDICEFQGYGDGVNLVNMATEEWVQNNYQPKGNYLTDVPSGYATEEFVENKIAAAELGSGEISLSDYAKKSELPTKVSQLTNDANYVKTEDIPTKTSQLTNDSGYWNSANYDSAIIGQGYVTCSTAAATVDKAVSLSNYLLKPGGIVSVRFVYSVPANATLCINRKAIIPIYYRNAAITDNVIKAGDIATFMFNGAKYTLLSIDRWQKDILDLTTEIGTKISIETDPTVPAWAKAANKPSYTASEVGLGNVDNVRQYSVNNPPPYPVTSVNGLTGEVTIDVPTIPSALKNPNALTFTGGASKTYDGSSAVSVEIPKLNYNPMTPHVYGAKGDGTTDDTAAFQNALTNNRTVFVPGGTYKLSGELVIRDNCQLELAQDVVLNFTNTSGNCITMNRSAFLKGNHATVFVPYAFTGRVINVDTSVHTNTKDVPPFTHWDPQWKTARYLTDLNICKVNSNGLHYSNSGDSNGTAVYVYANGSATSTFIWGMNFSGLRIAGAFEYGLRAISTGYNHEMRVEAFMDAVKIGVSLEDCNNAYISAIIQPRKAANETPYATHGIQLIRCQNTDLSGSRVWDWNAANSLWSYDKSNVNQHIAMYGDCMGTILNDYNYHYLPFGFDDLRELIYTDTPANFDSLIILQEPFTRWFRHVDNEPYFNNGDELKRLVLKEETDALFDTQLVKHFDDKLASATDASGAIFNGVGYKNGGYWQTDGTTFVDSPYHTCTGFIKCEAGKRLYVKGMSFNEGNDFCRIILYDSNYNKVIHVNRANLITNTSSYFLNNYTETEDGFFIDVVRETAVYLTISVYTSTVSNNPMAAVNEEIKYGHEGYLADGVKIKYENVEGLSEILGSYITDVDVLLGGDG